MAVRLKGCASPVKVSETISVLDRHSGPQSAEVTQQLAMATLLPSIVPQASKTTGELSIFGL